MSKHRHATYVVIEGEPFLSRARKWIAETKAYQEAWSAFAESRGATGWTMGGGALCFAKGKPPLGWTKPMGRHDAAHPKKGHPDLEAMKSLPNRPSTWPVFGDAVLYDLSYKGPGTNGSGLIGTFYFGPVIGWAGETIIGGIPDARAAAADHLAAHPDHIITNGADQWEIPQGLRRISEAERDLIFAQHQVSLERAGAAQ